MARGLGRAAGGDTTAPAIFFFIFSFGLATLLARQASEPKAVEQAVHLARFHASLQVANNYALTTELASRTRSRVFYASLVSPWKSTSASPPLAAQWKLTFAAAGVESRDDEDEEAGKEIWVGRSWKTSSEVAAGVTVRAEK